MNSAGEYLMMGGERDGEREEETGDVGVGDEDGDGD